MSLAEFSLPDDPPAPDAATLAGYRFTVVPHTHWDREWYQPFEVFRMRLARAVERICDVLEADPRFTSFTLDGQALMRVVGDVTISPVRLDETALPGDDPERPLRAGEIRSLRLVRR